MKATAILLGLFALLTVHGQAPPVENAACNLNFARILVEQQVIESSSITDSVKRIKILLRSAEFLWKLDQPTARGYFSEAYKIAEARFKETGHEEKKSDKGLFSLLPDQRMEVIRAIANIDPEWAKRLTEKVIADYEKSKDERSVNDRMREMSDILVLAQDSAKTNPELSRYLFRRVMRFQLFNHWYFVFQRLGNESVPFTASLYSEVLQNYRNETPRRLLYLSAYPFASNRVFGVEKYQLGFDRTNAEGENAALQRQFLASFFDRIAVYASSEVDINRPVEKYGMPEPVYMLAAIREIEPYIIERFPDLLSRFGAARAQAASLMNEEMRKHLDDREKSNAGLGKSFDERLAEVEKADEEGKLTDHMIMSLVTWGVKTEEQFVRIEPWLIKVRDEKVRVEMTNYFWFLRAKLAIKESRIEEAEKHSQKVPELEHRVILMFDIAEALYERQTNAGDLFDTLNRISKLARSAENSVAKAQILLGIANMYRKINMSVALDELGESIRVTNRLENPNMFSTSVIRHIAGKDFTFFAVLSTPGYDLEKTFDELSKVNFELSIANAKALDDRYLRTLAVIAVAKNCIKETKPAKRSRPGSK